MKNRMKAIIMVFVAALALNTMANLMFQEADSALLKIPNRWRPGDARRPFDLAENYDNIEYVVNGHIDTFNIEDGAIMDININATAAISDTKFGSVPGSNWALLSYADGTVDSADSQHIHAAIADGVRYIDYATGGATATVPAYAADDGLLITFSNYITTFASGAFRCSVCQSISVNGVELDNCAAGVPFDNSLFENTWTVGQVMHNNSQRRIIYNIDNGFSSSTVYTIVPGSCNVSSFPGAACVISCPGDNCCGDHERILVEGY